MVSRHQFSSDWTHRCARLPPRGWTLGRICLHGTQNASKSKVKIHLLLMEACPTDTGLHPPPCPCLVPRSNTATEPMQLHKERRRGATTMRHLGVIHAETAELQQGGATRDHNLGTVQFSTNWLQRTS